MTTNTPTKPSKEQIINHAIQLHLRRNILDAAKYYQRYIKQDTTFRSKNFDLRSYSFGKLLKNSSKVATLFWILCCSIYSAGSHEFVLPKVTKDSHA